MNAAVIRMVVSAGDIGVICLLGAGYSIGSLVVRKVS